MQYSAHYISGTHWDREWYRPFQEYRLLLVKLVDELLELMETRPEFRFFQLDGQTCVLDDYLEIRPENRARLAALIRARRILIGPWFTMPDLFCVGDEALIRNLLLGQRICREWDTTLMPVGFICDMFGHPSQMPQLFAGFGLRDVVLGRGTNEHTTPMFFEWESPDGTAAFVDKLQDRQGYGAFALPRAILENPDSEAGRQIRGYAEYKRALAEADGQPDKVRAAQETWVRQLLAEYIEHETARCNGQTIAVMDSMDHNPPAADVARYLQRIREACPNVVPQHSNLPAFFDEARRTAGPLPRRRGELREPSRERCPYLWLIPNCVSARVRLKQANDACQNLLEKWVEPLVALAEIHGQHPIPWRNYLRVAWKSVLLNHAHDSICGCSIDQVHRDMQARFDAARVLGEQLRAQAIGALTAQCAELGRGPHEFTLMLINPLPFERDEVVTFDVDLPPDYPAEFRDGFHTQTLKAFVLEDEAGRELPYQRLGMIPLTNERSRFAQFCFISDGPFTRYTVAARVTLPALGFTAWRVRPAQHAVRAWGSLRTGPTAAENEWLGIAIEPNGTLTLADKTTGEVYTGLLTFEDRSEVGDGWFHGHSLNDEVVLSSASPAQVAVVHEGPELVAFRVTHRLRLPVRYDPVHERPGTERRDLEISSVITLRRGARVVEVETTVDNQIEDHRLRVLFPTDATSAQTYLAHTPFDFVERPIALDGATATWQEADIAEKPFLGVQAVGAGRRGLAFVSPGGLHEGGVVDDQRRTMQVTLVRSFRKTVGTGGETDGLELGRLTYRFALMPFAGELDRAAVLREWARLQAGVFARQSGTRSSGFPPLAGTEPTKQQFLVAETGALAVSAIKPPEDGPGMIVRLWNPTDKPQRETLRFWRVPKRAYYVMLSEEPLSKPVPEQRGATVTVTAEPHAIVTVRVEW
ncbi:MAG: glycosyl hydrolase-related protein [Verrucomicrobiae bacterium]|nr:glycosyl hydrolase-related protein [Verrucomicrobiae bacterium]